MNLTFKGFLKLYCAELSGIKTTNIRRLVNAANTDFPRVAEPLFLYCILSDKINYLIAVSENAWMYEDYVNVFNIFNDNFDDIVTFLKSDFAPKRYAAVLHAFNMKDDMLKSNRRILEKLRPKVEYSLKKSGISRYKACKDLGINPGNFYAYLKGDNSKISEEIAYAVIDLCDDPSCVNKDFGLNDKNSNKKEDKVQFSNDNKTINVEVDGIAYKKLSQYAKENNTNIKELINGFLDEVMRDELE